MHEDLLSLPDLNRDDETLQDRIERARQLKSAAAARVRRIHADVKPVEFKVRAGDVTIVQKGYLYVS